MTNTTALYGTAAIPLIVGIIQLAKNADMPTNLAPLLALALGLAAGLLSIWQATTHGHDVLWPAGVVLGLTWGLGASGLYAAGKNAVQINPKPGA